MTRLFLILMLFISAPCLAAEQVGYRPGPVIVSGSVWLTPDTTQLTDAAATHTFFVPTRGAGTVSVSVVSDKGLSVVIYPVLFDDDQTSLGKASDTGTIADGGGSDEFRYTNFAAPMAKVVITKTEAGSTTDYMATIRGLAR